MNNPIHPVDQLVGQRVRMARLRRGMSQTALASGIGVTFQQLQKYEKATNRISASKLFSIARILETDVGSFFRDADVPGEEEVVDVGVMTRLDLLIIRELSRIESAGVKHHLLRVISALADNEKKQERVPSPA